MAAKKRRARADLKTEIKHEFKWEGSGWIEDKRRKNAVFYEGFHVGDLHVRVDDHVLIRNDDVQDAESPDQCYVSRIIQLYDDGSDSDTCHHAVVEWFSRWSDLCKRYQQAFSLPGSTAELVLDLRKHGFSRDIDAESIFALCKVEKVPVTYEIPLIKRNIGAEFYVRWQFTGSDKTPIINNDLIRSSGSKKQSCRSLFKSGSVSLTNMDSQNEPASHPPKSPVKNLMEKLFSPSKKGNALEFCTFEVDSVRRQIGDMIVSPHKSATSDSTHLGKDRLVKKLTFDDSESGPVDSRTSSAGSVGRSSIRLSSKGRKTYTPFYKADLELRTSNEQHREENRSTPESKRNRRSCVKTLDESPDVRRSGRKRVPNIRYVEDDTDSNENSKSEGKQKNLTNGDEHSSGGRSTSKKAKLSTRKHSEREDDSDGSLSEAETRQNFKKSRRDEVKSSSKLSTSKKPTVTPKSSRKATPAMPRRVEPCYTPNNALEIARSRLHVSVIPDRLPCRQKEFEEIYSFVSEKIMDGTSGCMYISGVPGTGKTATVYEVIRCLTVALENEEVNNFQFIAINGMKLTEPHQAYVQIVKELMNCKVTPEAAVEILEKRFTRSAPRREPVVLLVDELDLLWTGRQDVLYNIFDWPTRSKSKLIVVAIGNTMNLPEKIMMNRVVSRLGMTRMSFHAYTHKELKTIIMARIEELEAFMPDAVELVARKVASVSGDARRALDICRRAAEIAEFGSVSPSKRKKGIVGMSHVDAALQEMFISPKVEAIRHASLLEKMVLRSVLADFQQSGLEETTFSKMYLNLESLCCFEGVTSPSGSQAFAICSRLGACRLLLVEDGRKDIYQRIRMNVSTDDVHYALMS